LNEVSQLVLFETPPPKKQRVRPTPEELETLALTRLSKNFLLRDFLFSTECAALGLSNFPDDVDMVIRAGKALCERVLEPILEHFGQFSIIFGYQCRAGIEAEWSAKKRAENPRSSSPHQWDRKTWGEEVYARVDILPFCVEDGEVSKQAFGHWLMHNLDIDLLMQWRRANIVCITISPHPRRVWLEWGNPALGQPKQTMFMGADYWQRIYPTLPENERPKFAPSCTGGRMQWR
jgi:hypothetical protein